jgi:anti-sigma regulatory factor (Ser/Thr protein kinase)
MRASLKVRAERGAMRELEGLVEKFAAEQGLAADDKARTLIVIEELLTNLAKYGYADRSEVRGTAEVTLELEGNRLTIEFDDDGDAFDPFGKTAPDLNQAAESRPIGGLGLHMVRELAEEATYSRRNGRNVVRLCRRVTLRRTRRPSGEA